MKKTNYAARIKSVLKKNKRYNDGMSLLIDSTATSLITMDLCRKELDTLEQISVLERTRYGERLVPHPVFKTLRDAQAILLKNCKELGLSYSELSKMIEEENDPLTNFMRQFKEEEDTKG